MTVGADPGAVFYRGPSLLTGDPIVGVVTGLEGGSYNPKTGPMAQAWVIRPDLAPMDAVRDGGDAAICGDCALRGEGGLDRRCYVAPWLAPNNVYRVLRRGDTYIDATWPELQALVEGRHVRCCAYGDPAAVPFDIWRMLLTTAAGWTAYTHQWRRCDPRLQTIAMASVDSAEDFAAAQASGWRTFRVRTPRQPVFDGEVICPASDEGQHRTTCDRCSLCRGTNRPARSVVIFAHGHNGVMAAFHKRRSAGVST